MRVVHNKKSAGSVVEGFDAEFAEKVYKGCSIYHHLPFTEFFLKYRTLISQTDRWEYVVYDDNERILASMCIYIDPEEMHVLRPCVSILVAFSTDENAKALLKGYLWMKQIAKENEIEWVAYTRGKWPEGFFTNYKQVPKGVKNERKQDSSSR